MSVNSVRRFHGKYRGTVVDNEDPEQRGRLVVQVAGVTNVVPSTWALPCLPVASIQAGMYAVPTIGSHVWVEYEQGNPDFPIWTGCWWDSTADVPPLAIAGLPASPNILLQTFGQNSLVMSDLPGGPGITLKTKLGAMIVINDQGILISNGKGASISMVGNTVTINGGALTVM